MGYSNVQGSLNVLSSTSTQDLVVRGDALHLGNIVSTVGFATFGNVAIANLIVTGNFTITATNTQTTNALTINNAGTATALRVTQSEGGGPGHTHNVAEFWDFQTLAMVIDPEGNVGIHTTSSPGYALTVAGGAIVDTLALGTPLSIASGGTGTATTTNNWVFAGPAAGSAGPPSFRALVNTDLPQSISVSNVTANGAAIYSLNSSNLVGNVAQANVALVVSQPFQPNVTQVGTLVGLYSSGNVTASFFVGQGNALTNVLSSVLVGNVANANVALVVSQPSQSNITSVGTLTSLTVSGVAQAGLLIGNASGLSNVNGSNVSTVPTAGVVTNPAQTNITSVGTLTSLTISGVLQADLFTGNASALSNVNGANVSTVPTAQSVITPSQTNITSVGTLTGLYSSGNITATFFTGQGNGLTNVLSSVLVGNVANANVAGVVSNPSQPNIMSVGQLTMLTVSGVSQAGLFIGNASGLSNVNGANVSTVPTSGVVTNPAQINITSVGTLTSLTVSGILNSNLFTGNASGLSNLNSSNLVGNVANANVALVVSQPLQGNITRTGTLTALNVTGVSNLTDVYANGFTSNSTNTTFNFDTLTIPFVSATTLNVSTVSNIGIIYGQGNGISNIQSSVLVGNVANANVALVVSQPAQPNITSLGILNSLTVSGVLQASLFTGNASGLSNVTGSNVSTVPTAQSVTVASQGNITSLGTLTGLIVAGILNSNLFTGNASGLSNINSSNLVGNVANANVALVVSQPFQPNITQVGTLTGLYSSGNITATFFTGQGNGLTNVLSSVLVGNVANANVALVVSQPFQPNITQVGTLTGIYSSGNITATFFTGQGNGLTNVLSSVLVGNVASANVALVVSQPAQPNITSVGTLSSLTVQGVLRSDLFIGNASALSNVNGANVSTVPTSGVVTVASQPNITSVGTLTGLYSSGNITATFFTGQGNGLTNVLSSVLVGNVANANVALVVSQPAQPNITSVGTLSSLTVQGVLRSDLFIGNASALSNVNGANVSTVPTAQSVTVASQPNITSVGTLTSLSVQGISSSNLFVGNASALSNLNTANVTIGAFSASQLQTAQGNITSVGTLTGLTVSGNSNLQTLNVASIATPGVIPVSSGLFMNLNATYTLNSTGNWSGNIAGSITSNLFTLFSPNPVASWTTYGSNPLITGPTANGGFRFNQTGPYQFTVVLTSDNNIKTIALSSNTADVHSNLADPGVWLYCYRISVGQDPSIPVQIPFYVDSTSKYYFVDYEAVRKTGENIHKTAYTNVTAEGYTGSYVTLRPL